MNPQPPEPTDPAIWPMLSTTQIIEARKRKASKSRVNADTRELEELNEYLRDKVIQLQGEILRLSKLEKPKCVALLLAGGIEN